MSLATDLERPLTKCQNPSCQRMVAPVRRKMNRDGWGKYCSRECYHSWPPGMQEAYDRLTTNKLMLERWRDQGLPVKDPQQFMLKLIRFLNKRMKTWTARAAAVGVSRQTYHKWTGLLPRWEKYAQEK